MNKKDEGRGVRDQVRQLPLTRKRFSSHTSDISYARVLSAHHCEPDTKKIKMEGLGRVHLEGRKGRSIFDKYRDREYITVLDATAC